MQQLKHSFLLILLLLATAFSGWIFFQDDQSATAPEISEAKTSPTLKKPTPRHEMTGVSYSTTLDENTLFTLQADSITLRKKRVGFLRIGLMHEALIRNGIIHIYLQGPTPPHSEAGVDTNEQKSSHLISREIRDSLLPPLPSRRIVSVVCSPATLVIHHNNATETTISSPHATIDRRSNDIVFKGGAKAVSGERTMTANKILVSFKKRTIAAANNVVITTPRENSSLQQARTDLLLNIQN
jgi:hypothetical protein